jgi:hypothetical protein
MNNVIMRKIILTADYQPLASQSLVGSVTISAPPGNAGNVSFKGDDGSDVPWIPGEWHTFRSVDLSAIQAKGTPGDTVTVVGGTW